MQLVAAALVLAEGALGMRRLINLPPPHGGYEPSAPFCRLSQTHILPNIPLVLCKGSRSASRQGVVRLQLELLNVRPVWGFAVQQRPQQNGASSVEGH